MKIFKLVKSVEIYPLNGNDKANWIDADRVKFPDVEYSSELIGEKAYLTGLVIAFLLFILSWRMMNTYKLSNTTTEI
mgnify:CR=1 FL=1